MGNDQKQQQANSPYKKGWPLGVSPITCADIESLGVGKDGRLYWDGKPIEIRKTPSLSWWQKMGAIAATVSAVVVAFVELLTFLGYVCGQQYP